MRAFDQGTPSYEDRRTFRIVVDDRDDNPPAFDRQQFPPPYEVAVLEERNNITVGNLSLARDPDSGNNSVICYYLIGM